MKLTKLIKVYYRLINQFLLEFDFGTSGDECSCSSSILISGWSFIFEIVLLIYVAWLTIFAYIWLEVSLIISDCILFVNLDLFVKLFCSGTTYSESSFFLNLLLSSVFSGVFLLIEALESLTSSSRSQKVCDSFVSLLILESSPPFFPSIGYISALKSNFFLLEAGICISS
jgi:hypothetical protein